MNAGLRYDGPRVFSTDNPNLQRELSKIAHEIDRLFIAMADGQVRRWAQAPVLRASGVLTLDAMTPVIPNGATLLLTLPRWSTEIIGREVGIDRRDNTGTVNVISVAPALFCGGATALAIPAAQRAYIIVATTLGWTGVNDI